MTFRDVLPGGLLAGGAFFVLQLISSLIISHYLSGAQSTYGSFATVITILWWFYPGADHAARCAAERRITERLYPRSLVGGPETEATTERSNSTWTRPPTTRARRWRRGSAPSGTRV